MPWLSHLTQRPAPSVLLFAFPHAGGGAHAYASWAELLPDWVELVAVTLPGRGNRLNEPPLTDILELAREVADEIAQGEARQLPFALFGHSLGALIAFEVARRLEHLSISPLLLLASAHAAPQLSQISATEWLHTLDQTQLISELSIRGWLPDEALEQPQELFEMMMNTMRADLQLHEQYTATDTQLACTVVALGGTADEYVPAHTVEAWRAHSQAHAAVEWFQGGHFFTQTCESEVLVKLEHHLQACLSSLPLSVQTGPEIELPDMTIDQLFDQQVARVPDHVALEDKNNSFSYKQLSDMSTQLACVLQGLGAAVGEAVGVYMPKQAEYVIGYLAVLKAGCALLLIEINYTGNIISELLKTVSARIVMTVGAVCDDLPQELRDSPNALLLDDTAWMSLPCDPLKPAPSDLDRVTWYTMTSGSTGAPKAVANTHRGGLVSFLSRPYPYSEHQQEREALNIFFAWECLRPLIHGATAVVIDDTLIVDPKKIVNFIRDKKITRLMTTPTLLEAILDHPKLDLGSAFSTLRHWFLEGEPVPCRILKKWHARVAPEQYRTLVNYYATWEALDDACCTLDPTIDSTVTGGGHAPAGNALAGVQLFIVDGLEQCNLQPRGVPGEVLVAGPVLADGYAGDVAKTEARFVMKSINGHDSIRVYHTGDRGRIMRDGRLQVLGRADSTVKIRGFKVGIDMVEAAVSALDHVGRACVMPIKDENGTVTSLCAYLVPNPEKAVAESQLVEQVKAQARTVLPEYAVPLHWMVLKEFPTKSGESKKLDRQKLPLPDTQQLAQSTAHNLPASRVESAILECWKTVLGLESIDTEDNFFEIGGHSLLAGRLVAELSLRFGLTFSVLDLYDNPSIKMLSRKINPKPAAPPAARREPRRETGLGGDVAVIGMSGKFPSMDSIDEFWEGLVQGSDSLRRFSNEDLILKGADSMMVNNPNYIKVGQVLNDADKFDAGFWGISREEATIMDPQHRVFLEVAWAAVENAGYAPRTGSGTGTEMGVFASCGIDGYLVHHLNGGALKTPEDPGLLFLTEVGSEKDYIATRVSYALDIGGPSINVQSACSSGLVAVAQAVQAIRAGACDAAVAGASALSFPNMGYMYQDGLVSSPDGFVRPFDQQAAGTLFGDAVGALVLKRQSYAEQDGDNILATIKGYGISNDGAMKAGYTAPSATGQKNAIVSAMRMANVTPDMMAYVECHATGTNIGDGIEMRGLSEAFSELGGTADHKVAIGSVKGNIGHANCAAGVTGLIKTILCLQKRQLVPTAHFTELSHKVDLRDTPFFVHEGNTDWNGDTMVAGVSAFGIGGTNCHLVLEEYKPPPTTKPASARVHQLLTVSAKSKESLMMNTEALAAHLEAPDTPDLSDVAYTLHVGREHFRYSWSVTGLDKAQAAAALRDQASKGPTAVTSSTPENSVVFAFPGQGSQYGQMAETLWKNEPLFREHFDHCDSLLSEVCGVVLSERIFAQDTKQESRDACAEALKDPRVAQPAILCVEYALGKTLLDLGVTPTAMVGHSIGEYSAAVLSGKLGLRDALEIVWLRSSSMADHCEGGAMLSVSMAAAAAAEFAESHDGVWLACDNSPQHQVLSVSLDVVEAVQAELEERGVRNTALHVTHGFHSAMVEPAAQAVTKFTQGVQLGTSSIPFTSNVTGSWFSEDCEEPEYWGRHITGTVRFRENVDAILEWNPSIVLEVGPGTTMCSLISKCVKASTASTIPQMIACMCHPKAQELDDERAFTAVLGKLWSMGVSIDWTKYHNGERQQRVPLPSYCFEKLSFWKNPSKSIYVEGGPEADDTAPKFQSFLRGQAHTSLVDYSPMVNSPILLKLYCFPFAGGSSQLFASWAKSAPAGLHVIAIELAGRGGRTSEAMPSSDLEDHAQLEEIAAAIQQDSSDGTPYALVGCSMGALMALRVANMMPASHRARHGQLRHFVVAGRAPVGYHMKMAEQTAGAIDVESFSVAPPELKGTEVWNTYLLPLLTADLEADARAEAHLYQALRALPTPLSCPVDVLCGLDDSACPKEIVHEWASVTSNLTTHHFLAGDHSFLNDASDEIFMRLRRSMEPYLSLKDTTTVNSGSDAARSMVFEVAWNRIASVSRESIIQAPSALVLDLGSSVEALDLDSTLTLQAYKQALCSPSGLILRLVCPESDLESAALQFDTEQSWALLSLIHKLVELQATGRLVLVCPASERGAMAVGASKSIPLEFPEISVQRVFVERLETYDNATLEGLCDLVYNKHTSDSDLLIGHGRKRMAVMAPRLQKVSIPQTPKHALVYDDSTEPVFIVTGGLGGVGSAVVDWLLDSQHVPAHNIIILSRRAMLHPRGCTVIQADLTDLPTLLDLPVWERVTNVEGILHLAGVLDDGLLTNMTHERMAKTIAPKAGFANLIELVDQMGWTPQYAVGFSSTSSLFGYPGQSNYCAANAYIDQKAQWGEHCRTPLVSINWSAWNAGMAAKGTKAYESSLRNGEQPIDVSQGIECLHHVLSLVMDRGPHQLCVADCHWSHTPWRDQACVQQLRLEQDRLNEVRSDSSYTEEDSLSQGNESAVFKFLEQKVSKWAPDETMSDLGLDSLDMAQMRAGFNKEFSQNVGMSVFANPLQTLAELGSRLQELVNVGEIPEGG